MVEPAAVEQIPLALDADQVIRVGGSRVPLETVISVFNTGATPEEIAQNFPALRLDDIYAVITYYLRHRDEVAEYLRRRGAEADAIRQQIDQDQPQDDLRQRLLARRGR